MPGLAAILLFANIVGVTNLAPVQFDDGIEIGGDLRYFQFLALENIDLPGLPNQRRDSELGVARLKLNVPLGEELSFEVHGVVQGTSPARAGSFSIASGTTRRFLNLETDISTDPDLRTKAEIDRLTLSWEQSGFQLVAGRQAITWGVNFFWPVLDLFAPFKPERIDREYKPGVDAVRLTVQLGDFSQIELIGAGQGKDLDEDFSVGALGRFNVGATDIGVMAGHFHGDNVLGGFVTSDLAGTGLRAEVAWTNSGDVLDALIGRESFWRASLGIDRQLTPRITLIAEAAYEGFGGKDAVDYLQIAIADRVRRGEITSLGRYYTGVSMAWLAGPLITTGAAVLTNWTDGSTLIQPNMSWSLSDNSVVLFGVIMGFGKGIASFPAQPEIVARLGSEYGATPVSVWGAFKTYF